MSSKNQILITHQSKNVVYLIWCEECKLQGVGRTLKMNTRLSNYYSHIKQKRRTCSSVNHFIDKHANNWKDVLSIMGIVSTEEVQAYFHCTVFYSLA